MTVNLGNGAASPTAVRRLLRAERPHVVAAQELAPDAAAALAGELPHGRLDPGIDYHGAGLALRHPGVVERFPLEHRDGMRAVLEPALWPGLSSPLEILTVHLHNPIDRPLRRAAEIRRNQVEQLLGHVSATPMSRVLAGDLNATPRWRAYRRLAAVLGDAPLMTGGARRTWSPGWWLPRFLRIDHVLVTGVVPVRAVTRRIRRTDHSAVIVDFDLDR
jgi:endonuclease/exonuclease/phosphatase family metal-dependent hydrolase